MVCACTPCEASTISSAPSQAAMERETSYEKSTCPGVSIRFRTYFSPLYMYSIWMAWLLMVIPLSFSKSISSSIWPSVTCIVLVNSSKRSAKVDLPWSMWAIMQKLRIFFIFYLILKIYLLYHLLLNILVQAPALIGRTPSTANHGFMPDNFPFFLQKYEKSVEMKILCQ